MHNRKIATLTLSFSVLTAGWWGLQQIAATSRTETFIGYAEIARPVHPTDRRVVIDTEKGRISILLLHKNAPQTTEAIVRLAARQEECVSCRFYRNEARPAAGDLGPPYGLLQGSLSSIDGLPPREGNLVTRRGHACMIPGTKEFFIALSDHSEWGTAHTVWGEAEDMDVIDALVAAPYHILKHPDYGTIMRIMDSEVPFRISLASSSSES